jgi:hypothetical protein
MQIGVFDTSPLALKCRWHLTPSASIATSHASLRSYRHHSELVVTSLSNSITCGVSTRRGTARSGTRIPRSHRKVPQHRRGVSQGRR